MLTLPAGADAQLAEILDIVENTQARVNTAVSQAQAARLAAEEVRTQVRAGLAAQTPELRAFIEEAITEAQAILAHEAEGLEAFAPGGQCGAVCEAFRAELVGALSGSANLMSAILESTGNTALPDLNEALALAQLAPPRLLYPLHRMFQGALGAGLGDELGRLTQDTRAVVPLAMPSTPDACAIIVADTDRIQGWASRAMGVGALLHMVGGVAKFLGATEFAGEAGVAGFVSGTIKSNKRKQIGDVVDTAATLIDKAAGFVTTKVRYCLIFAFQDETRTTLASMETILSGLDLDLGHLDLPVSTRATQASVDAVQTTLQGVARDVSLLLEQGGGTPGPPGASLTLRVQIEQQLWSSDRPLSVFYLPEQFGGLLDVVRDRVEGTLTQHQAAGFPVQQAWTFLSKGDQARASFDYRAAYGWYQHAYRMATAGRPAQKGR